MGQSCSGILYNFFKELYGSVHSDMENSPRYMVKLKKKKERSTKVFCYATTCIWKQKYIIIKINACTWGEYV